MSAELKLTSQQQDAIDKFTKLKVGAIFMKPGCGKTRTAVELVNYNHPDYLLYLTPHSTISNIKDELDKWGVNCEYDIVGWVTCNMSEYNATYHTATAGFTEYDTDSIVTLFGELQKVAAEAPEKNRNVADYIKGKPIICFCNYINEINQIKRNLSGECYIITGETKTKDRDAQIKDFREKADKPLLMTLGVGSYSLNLQFCNEIVYSSITFNYGKFEQSKYRIKRTGQERDISYTYILGDFGINGMMFRNLDGKESLAEIVKRLLQKESVDEFKEELRKELKV